MGQVAKLCDMMCVSFGKSADVCFSGGSDGNVFVWQGSNLQKTVKAHDGPVFAMHSLDRVRMSVGLCYDLIVAVVVVIEPH